MCSCVTCVHQCSQAIPALALKPCVLAKKSSMLNFCQVCATICGDCHLWEPITQDTKRFAVLREKEQSTKQKNITTTFGKSLVLTQYRIRYTIYMPPNAKRPHNKPDDGCLWKPGKRNNTRTSKQL